MHHHDDTAHVFYLQKTKATSNSAVNTVNVLSKQATLTLVLLTLAGYLCWLRPGANSRYSLL